MISRQKSAKTILFCQEKTYNLRKMNHYSVILESERCFQNEWLCQTCPRHFFPERATDVLLLIHYHLVIQSFKFFKVWKKFHLFYPKNILHLMRLKNFNFIRKLPTVLKKEKKIIALKKEPLVFFFQ